jgi:hypothetical protein
MKRQSVGRFIALYGASDYLIVSQDERRNGIK